MASIPRDSLADAADEFDPLNDDKSAKLTTTSSGESGR
jgi:hypothetical protein